MSSSFPPAATVTSDSQRRLQASLGKLRQSASRLRISVSRMAAAIPPCARPGATVEEARAYHEAVKADSALWKAQPVIGYTNAQGCLPAEGEAVGGSLRNCIHCHSTMFRKEGGR